MPEISGQIQHIVYQNESNGYTVCELSTDDGDYLTAVGIMPFIAVGETISAMGKWETHASYGKQFKIECYEKQLPTSAGAILKYLSSRTVKGIGPKTAERIVEKYGEDTFDVIENHPEWLEDIPGISKAKAIEISESFRQNFGVRSVMMFCRDFFGPATAVKVYKKWGGAAVDLIRSDPYLLCEEINGVGFDCADRIAATLGMEKDSVQRLRSGLKYFLLFNARQNGHCFVPEDKMLPAAAKMLGVDENSVLGALAQLIESGQVVVSEYENRRCIYLKDYYDAERYVADKLVLLDRQCECISLKDADRFIEQLQSELGIEYAAMQKKAIKLALGGGVMVLTGGPGTGKTTVIRALMLTFDRMGYSIALAAPTGRAAKRMSEATGREAKTIHRLLEMEYTDESEPRFRRGEDDRLDDDVIIIDEASMVDIKLMEALLKAVKPGARLLIIGDSDQLPSVGAGLVLSDIMASGIFSTVKLKEIFRQSESSLIVTNAHAINRGEMPELSSKNSDFFFISRQNDELTARTVADLIVNRLPRKYGEKIRDEIQVITPSHKGAAGTDRLNELLQGALNPPSPGKKEKKTHEMIFREGDRVMQIKNNYDIAWQKDGVDGIGVFNGDIGVIMSIDTETESMIINYDDKITPYGFDMLDELDHAYAITVHKSQGSEYPVVIIPAYMYSPRLLTRNLLYTAVTRAQDMVIIVGEAGVVSAMVENDRRDIRYTGLAYMLSESVNS